MNQVMITVIGKDRAGIIARVTGILFRHGANLEDISMTILEGEFAMMMIASLKRPGSGSRLLRALKILEKELGLSVLIKSVEGKLRRGEKHGPGTDTYLITLLGADKTGIVYKASSLLARYRLNITDLNCKILGRGRKAVYAMLLEADVPKRFAREKLMRAFRDLSKSLNLDVSVKPLERLQF